MLLIFSNDFAHLLLLKFPNVLSLVCIGKCLGLWWQINSKSFVLTRTILLFDIVLILVHEIL